MLFVHESIPGLKHVIKIIISYERNVSSMSISYMSLKIDDIPTGRVLENYVFFGDPCLTLYQVNETRTLCYLLLYTSIYHI